MVNKLNFSKFTYISTLSVILPYLHVWIVGGNQSILIKTHTDTENMQIPQSTITSAAQTHDISLLGPLNVKIQYYSKTCCWGLSKPRLAILMFFVCFFV